MASTLLGFNPALTTNAAGFFSVSEDGLVQGTALDDPAARFQLAGGVWDPAATVTGYGGMGVYNNVPLSTAGLTTAAESFGGYVGPATNLSTAGAASSLTGFMVFDQAINGIITPQTPVPQLVSGMTVNYYKLGSNARIAVSMAPALVNLDGGIITQPVSWDFVNQQLIPYSAAYPQTTITGASWSTTAGGRTDFTVGTDLTGDIDAGDVINVSGVVNTGGTSTSAFNGQFSVVSITSTHIIVTQAAASSPGTYASGGVVLAGGGALPCKILKVKTTNCLTVNPATFTWNTNGACAIIQI